jgi:polyphosphate glucokinase
MEILGVDIGGSGIKGAPVDVEQGVLAAARYRIPTPQPSRPKAVARTVAKIADHFDWQGPIGCTFPAVVKKGVVYSAANVDDAWIGTDGARLLGKNAGCPVTLLNDADAAGIAEMQLGAGKGRQGVVFVLTFGTGIGTAIFVDGKLVPNCELGHVPFRCKKGSIVDGEEWATDRVRKEEALDWKTWAGRVSEFLSLLEALFSPDLFIIGGGVSKKHAKFLPLLEIKTEAVPAKLRNEAGIVGAALAAKGL